MKTTDAMIATAVPLLWGLGLVVAKPVVETFPPILLMALRFSVAALLLVWFAPMPKRHLAALALVALVGSTLQYGLTFNGLKRLDAGTTALIVQAEVVFLVIIAAIWLGERLGLRQIIGMVVAFAGLWIVYGTPRLQGQEGGIAMVLGGGLFWAFGQVMVRRLGDLGGVTTVAWVSVLAAPQLIVLSLVVEGDPRPALVEADWRVWISVLYLGVMMTALAYACWYHVLGKYQAGQVGPFLLMTPVASVLGGALFLGEPLTREIVLGGAVLIAGVGVLVIEKSEVSDR